MSEISGKTFDLDNPGEKAKIKEAISKAFPGATDVFVRLQDLHSDPLKDLFKDLDVNDHFEDLDYLRDISYNLARKGFAIVFSRKKEKGFPKTVWKQAEKAATFFGKTVERLMYCPFTVKSKLLVRGQTTYHGYVFFYDS